MWAQGFRRLARSGLAPKEWGCVSDGLERQRRVGGVESSIRVSGLRFDGAGNKARCAGPPKPSGSLDIFSCQPFTTALERRDC